MLGDPTMIVKLPVFPFQSFSQCWVTALGVFPDVTGLYFTVHITFRYFQSSLSQVFPLSLDCYLLFLLLQAHAF